LRNKDAPERQSGCAEDEQRFEETVKKVAQAHAPQNPPKAKP
jgi:hypothetical protein